MLNPILPDPYHVVDRDDLLASLSIAFRLVTASVRNDFASTQKDRFVAQQRREVAADKLAQVVTDHLAMCRRYVIAENPDVGTLSLRIGHLDPP
jgi:hypothetical protein